MSAPQKEQQIPMTNLDAEEDKMHQGFKGNLDAAGHPGETRPPHETNPITGAMGKIKEIGPYLKTSIQEKIEGVGRTTFDREAESKLPSDISAYREKEIKEAA